MQAKIIAAILGITETRQVQVLKLISETLADFAHRGLYNEETLLQSLAVRTKYFTPQERTFAIYFAGRYVEKFLGGDMPRDIETVVKQIYQNEELTSLHPERM